MKHIKLYESVSNDIVYYKHMGVVSKNRDIIYGDNRELKSNIVDITHMEEDEILNNLSDKDINEEIDVNNERYRLTFTAHLTVKYAFTVYKDYDDYFYLIIYGAGYKCDGIDNLVKLIDTLLFALDSNRAIFYQINSILNLNT